MIEQPQDIHLSIVIINWNTRDLLKACLESVDEERSALTDLGIETIVVDNASSDDSVQMLQEQFSWVKLIENDNNLGFARANNQAIAISQGEYVLLLNSDTIVKSGALKTLIQFMEQNPDAGACGSRLLNPNGTLQISCSPAPTVWSELYRLLYLDNLYPLAIYRMHGWSTSEPRLVDNVQGAAMLLRRRVIETVGVLDDQYFMYTEEVDLCRRIRVAGWKIYWVPQSRIIHYGGQSSKQIAAEMFLHLYLSKLIYIRKHYGQTYGSLYKFGGGSKLGLHF
ncbi:glycosyltransferase family 2 protein [Chloroflexi bacterium TSY]|nr:glycosyltransferase family 2 protein [Chloroflexi bacterium TSY]